MPNIINLFSTGGSGATFLSWTIYYLTSPVLQMRHLPAGSFSNANSKYTLETSDIVNNPLSTSNLNSHKHRPILITTTQLADVIAMLHSKGATKELFVLYSVFNNESFVNRTQTDYKTIIRQNPKIAKNVMFKYTECDIDTVYMWKFDREKVIDGTKLQHLDVWDRRELLSLEYTQSVFNQTMAEDCSSCSEVVFLNFSEYINYFDQTVFKFITSIGLSVIDSRVDSWKVAYKKWQQLVDVNFINDLDLIVNNIITNKPHDLTIYNMTLSKEIILCKRLLFNYSLQPRMFGITNMPLNTSQWYSMLEPSIHPEESYKHK